MFYVLHNKRMLAGFVPLTFYVAMYMCLRLLLHRRPHVPNHPVEDDELRPQKVIHMIHPEEATVEDGGVESVEDSAPLEGTPIESQGEGDTC